MMFTGALADKIRARAACMKTRKPIVGFSSRGEIDDQFSGFSSSHDQARAKRGDIYKTT